MHNLPLADIIFIQDFAAFARSKGDGRYEFTDTRSCALGQFGHPGLLCAQIVEKFGRDIFDAVNPIGGDWTFSALADRLEALLPATVEKS